MNYMKQAQNIWEQFNCTDNYTEVEHFKKDWCSDCDVQMISTGNMDFMGCPMCGACDVLESSFVCHEAWVKKQSMYKRRLYCREKLNLLAGYKQSASPLYNKLIAKLKKKKIRNIVHLKQILKDMGHRKFYKYMYNIYHDVKGVRLIKLTSQQIDKLSIQFVHMETEFKQNDRYGRKNFFNYNSMIYELMKRNKMTGYKSIILPLNFLDIAKDMRKLIR